MRLLMAALCVLLLSGSSVSSSLAAPDAPGYVPPEVGLLAEGFDACAAVPVIAALTGVGTGALVGGVPGAVVGVSLILIGVIGEGVCESFDDRMQEAFEQAYIDAENAGMSPGYPTNRIHGWADVLLQDFSGSDLGDGWGAIVICNEDCGDSVTPYYVGGSTWRAYERAVNTDSVLGEGILPGYPTGPQHQWNRVTIQDFSGGSWGITGIIGGDQETAWVVAGNHLQAYIDADGSNTLGNPLGPVEYVDGWYEQRFEDGVILELDGQTQVQYYESEDTANDVPDQEDEQVDPPADEGVIDPPASDEGSTDLSQFVAMCHYYWDGGGWVENNCGPVSASMGELLYEPLMDGCNYFYDGSFFYQNYDYDC